MRFLLFFITLFVGFPAKGVGDVVVSNQYDAEGHLIEITDGRGQITAFSYDGINRNTSSTWDPDTAVARTETSFYDSLLLTGKTDPKLQNVTFSYDDLFRITDAIYAGRAQDDRQMSYDLVGNLLAVTYPNESADKQTIREASQSYDNLNRLVSETSNGVTHGTTFDKAGNTLTQTYGQTGRVLTCDYDALNRLKNCSEAVGAAAARVTSYAYDLNGNIVRKTLPNLTQSYQVYDALNRCAAISNRRSDASVIQSTQMVYDAVGNVTQLVESSASTAISGGTMTTANVYDKVYRLLTETRTDTGTSPTEIKATTYGYDKANNRASKSLVTNGGAPELTTYDFSGVASGYNSNQLIGYNRPATAENVAFTYDANGSRATRTIGLKTDTYSYDHDDRLVTLDYQSDPDATKNGVYNYLYDHRTRRVNRDESAVTNGENTRVVFSNGLSVQEHNQLATGNWQLSTPSVETIRGSDYGGGVGGVLYTLRSGAPSFNYYNSRGDVLAKTDATEAITWQANYEAFGTRTAENGTTEDRQKANTKDEDPTGLLNEGMRYRDLEAGVFITRDPAGFVDGPNVYTYVRQNPWTFFDPLGLNMFSDFVGGAWNQVSQEANEIAHGVAQAGVIVEIAGRGIGNSVAGTWGGNVNVDAGYDRLQRVQDHKESYGREIKGATAEVANADTSSTSYKAGGYTVVAVEAAVALNQLAKTGGTAVTAFREGFEEGAQAAGTSGRAAAQASEAAAAAPKTAGTAERGGLNLFRAGPDNLATREAATGWRQGDRMLHLPNQGSPQANWAQNAGRLRQEMRAGEPIFDSYRDAATGLQIPVGTTPTSGGRFLNAERKLLESRGWQYNPSSGVYHPSTP